nr:MAG: internal scaffolding protein [Microvirus sp.]
MKTDNLFRTQYHREQKISNSGERFAPIYSPKVSDTGVIDLVETGKVDTYAQIQAWRESCDIKVILQKYINGDSSALNKNTPLFGDFTDAPTNLVEYYQTMIDAENAFNNLPVDTRAKFNHSPSEFFTSIGTDRFNEAMGYNQTPLETPPYIVPDTPPAE